MRPDDVPMLVYLLCDLARQSKTRHYIGSTRPEMWKRRMQDHLAGNGCETTRRMLRQGAVLHLAAIWPADSRDFEKRVKRGGHFKNYCPVCTEELRSGNRPAYEQQSPNNLTPMNWSPLVFQ